MGGHVPENLSPRTYRERASRHFVWDGGGSRAERRLHIYPCVGRLFRKQAEGFNKAFLLTPGGIQKQMGLCQGSAEVSAVFGVL